jgi:hypothetical protein
LKDEITPAAAEARSKGATAEEIRQKTLDLIALCGDDKQLLTVQKNEFDVIQFC